MQLRLSSYFTVISNALPCGAENWRIEKIVVYRLDFLKIRRLGLISRKSTETSCYTRRSVFPADYNVKLSRHQIPGGYFLVILMRMCPWMGSHQFMTALTNNRAAFSATQPFLESSALRDDTKNGCVADYIFNWGTWIHGVAHFRDLGGHKIQVGRDFKTLREDFYVIKFNKCVNVLQSSRMT